MSKKILKQTDANTCLACVFLYVVEWLSGQKFSSEDEQQLYSDSFGKCRESFALSYTLAFVERFPNFKVKITTNNEFFGGYLKKLLPENQQTQVKIETFPITLELIRKKVAENPLILMVDKYFLDHEIHIPHYIVVIAQEGENFFISDPWEGKNISVSSTQLQEAIFGAKNYLFWAPIAIEVKHLAIDDII